MIPKSNQLHRTSVENTAIVPRSKISNDFRHRTTFKHGKLVPIYCSQTLPGANYKISLSSFIRLATPLTATMDNLVADVYFFFVPNRIIFNDFESFMGITTNGAWPTTNVNTMAPTFVAASGTSPQYNEDDAMVYLGSYPMYTNVASNYSSNSFEPSILPLRAYMQIWNDYFRDPNFEKIIPFTKTASNVMITSRQLITEANWMAQLQMGYGLAPVCKNRDMFTACFQAPQKGGSVLIPSNNTYLRNIGGGTTMYQTRGASGPMAINFGSSATTATNSYTYSNAGILASEISGTINQLRQAFAVQTYLENDMNNRYKDSLLSHFGVSNDDDVLQMAQYIGGNRFRINMNSIVQNTSATVDKGESSYTTPAGYVAGYSATSNNSTGINFTAKEHGWLIGVCCTRIEKHSYSQGFNPLLNYKTRLDIYSPEFANLPYQAVYKSALYLDPTHTSSVFGYAPAWWQYRVKFDQNSGYFATQSSETLDYWHYGDYFSSSPTLQASFLHEESYQLERTLAISDDSKHPYIADFFFNETDVLPMPAYSKPGLPIHA